MLAPMKTTPLPLRKSVNHSPVAALLLILFLLRCFVLSPTALAQLSPAPDGCYSNFTTAEGCAALASLTTGAGNTALGWRSLVFNSSGSFNTGVGGGALALNNADSNTAVGAAALLLNTTGAQNVAIGTDALVFNDIGSENNAVGAFALFNNVSGSSNNAYGRDALFENIDGSHNNAFGDLALEFNTSGSFNTAVGDNALFTNVTGSFNTALGDQAGDHMVDGSENTVVGATAGTNIEIGSGNIYLGVRAGEGAPDEFDVIRIGEPNPPIPYDCYIQGIDFRNVGDGVPKQVFVTDDGKLANPASSRRFKHDIKPMDKASEVILELEPVSFHYNNDAKNIPFFGLIAEEVAKVSADLVAPDKEGKPYTVRYEQINAMLLNEFIKEHRTVQEQGATIARLENQIAAVAAGLQKVSAELELSKAAPRTAGNQ